MRKYPGIEEKYKDKLLDSILNRLNGLVKTKWEEIAREDDTFASTMNAISWDIKNLQRGQVPSHLRKRNKSLEKNDLFTRKVTASARRIRRQTTSVKSRLKN